MKERANATWNSIPIDALPHLKLTECQLLYPETWKPSRLMLSETMWNRGYENYKMGKNGRM